MISPVRRVGKKYWIFWGVPISYRRSGVRRRRHVRIDVFWNIWRRQWCWCACSLEPSNHKQLEYVTNQPNLFRAYKRLIEAYRSGWGS